MTAPEHGGSSPERVLPGSEEVGDGDFSGKEREAEKETSLEKVESKTEAETAGSVGEDIPEETVETHVIRDGDAQVVREGEDLAKEAKTTLFKKKKKGVMKKLDLWGPQGANPTIGDAKEKSWSSVVKPTHTMKQYEVSVEMVDGEETLLLPDCVFGGAPIWEDCLIGKFPEKAPHVAAIHLIVNKIWSLGDKSVNVEVFVENETTVKFRINDAGVRKRVLQRRMWNIKNVPMMVSQWSPNIEDAQPALKSIPLWVVLRNVPQSLFSWEGLCGLTSYFGVPRRLHPETLWCKTFEEARIFVDVDLSKTLPKAYSVPLKNGEKVTVSYEYPWLPSRCVSCNKWGHEKNDCMAIPGSLKILGREPSTSKKSEVGEAKLTVAGAQPASIRESNGTHNTTHQSLGREPGSLGKHGDVSPKKSGARPARVLNSEGVHEVENSVEVDHLSLVREPSTSEKATLNGTGALPASDTNGSTIEVLEKQTKAMKDSTIYEELPQMTEQQHKGPNVEEVGWKLVSPKKAARSHSVDETELTSSSGSRYSALLGSENREEEFDVKETDAEFDEDEEMDTDVENTGSSFHSPKGNMEKKQQWVVPRLSLPRQSKFNHKVVKDVSYYLDKSQLGKQESKLKHGQFQNTGLNQNSGSKKSRKRSSTTHH